MELSALGRAGGFPQRVLEERDTETEDFLGHKDNALGLCIQYRELVQREKYSVPKKRRCPMYPEIKLNPTANEFRPGNQIPGGTLDVQGNHPAHQGYQKLPFSMQSDTTSTPAIHTNDPPRVYGQPRELRCHDGAKLIMVPWEIRDSQGKLVSSGDLSPGGTIYNQNDDSAYFERLGYPNQSSSAPGPPSDPRTDLQDTTGPPTAGEVVQRRIDQGHLSRRAAFIAAKYVSSTSAKDIINRLSLGKLNEFISVSVDYNTEKFRHNTSSKPRNERSEKRLITSELNNLLNTKYSLGPLKYDREGILKRTRNNQVIEYYRDNTLRFQTPTAPTEKPFNPKYDESAAPVVSSTDEYSQGQSDTPTAEPEDRDLAPTVVSSTSGYYQQ